MFENGAFTPARAQVAPAAPRPRLPAAKAVAARHAGRHQEVRKYAEAARPPTEGESAEKERMKGHSLKDRESHRPVGR